MHRYQVGEKLGDGTYGEVLRATNKSSGEIVAISLWGSIWCSQEGAGGVTSMLGIGAYTAARTCII